MEKQGHTAGLNQKLENAWKETIYFPIFFPLKSPG
jgi:hypothetical protein